MIKRVLIVSTTGMGDCLWGTPGIRALKKTFPGIKIDLLVNWRWRSLFQFNPHLNQIFDYHEQWYAQPILGCRLLGKDYDAVYIFHANRNFKRMLPWLRSVPTWCYQDFSWMPESQRIKINAHVHGIEKRLVMLEKFGVKPDGGQMEIFIDQATKDKSQQFFQTHDFSPGKYIYLNLGAAVESRRWMVERFSELASRILKNTTWNIILGGGLDEKSRAYAILNQINSSRVIEVCTQPVLVNANLIANARLMVTADTGPMYIGLAMKIPIVALFGTIALICSGPYETPDHLCRVIKIEPNLNAEELDPGKFHFRCITVDMVWTQIQQMI